MCIFYILSAKRRELARFTPFFPKKKSLAAPLSSPFAAPPQKEKKRKNELLSSKIPRPALHKRVNDAPDRPDDHGNADQNRAI